LKKGATLSTSCIDAAVDALRTSSRDML
jgi:hypothetical protein